MRRRILLIPLALFLLLVAVLFWQLTRNAAGDDPSQLESTLMGKPLPAFRLAALDDPNVTYDRAALLNGKPLLLNVWATWCPTCRAEHQFLDGLAANGVRIVGLNYKDDRAKAVAWLNTLGNPYALSLFDGSGMLGLDLGVYGAPETFVIDGRGVIRYRLAGELNDQVWRQDVKPLWDALNQEVEP
ncbi:DsbE family thiol:disulfide interchange protein [Cronobacter universalis]